MPSLLGKFTGFLFLRFCEICGRMHAATRNTGSSESASLREEIRRLSSANRIMKQFIRKRKMKASFLIKLRMVLFVLGSRIPLRRIRGYLPVTRSTIRRYVAAIRANLFGLRQKSSRPKSSPKKTPTDISSLIRKIKEDNPSWGYLRIALHLWRLQMFLSPSTVRRVLLSPPSRLLPKGTFTHAVDGKIVVTEPNHLWSIDLTNAYILGISPIYVLGVIDHYSRKVFCLASSFHPTADWVMQALERVFTSFGKPKAIMSDNGSQFVSGLFRTVLASHGILRVRTAVRHPQTNGKIERFFQSLKQEFICLFFPASRKCLDALLLEYLTYYNQYRLHEAIDGQPPDAVHYGRLIPKPDKTAKRIRAPIEEIRLGNGLLRAYRLRQAA